MTLKWWAGDAMANHEPDYNFNKSVKVSRKPQMIRYIIQNYQIDNRNGFDLESRLSYLGAHFCRIS